MVVAIVTEIGWESIKNYFINKDTFRQQVYDVLMENLQIYRSEDCKIVLPNTVTTAERHKIHILTRLGFFPRSKGEGSNRIMEIFITPEFFEELHQEFKSDELEEVVVEEPVQTDPMIALKTAILEDIMLLVEKHFNDIFLKHYT